VAVNATNRKFFRLLRNCHAVWPLNTNHVENLANSTLLAVDNTVPQPLIAYTMSVMNRHAK
jgi:hypothetical protein